MTLREIKLAIKEVIQEKLESNEEEQLKSLMSLEPNEGDDLLNLLKSLVGSLNGVLDKYPHLTPEFKQRFKALLVAKLEQKPLPEIPQGEPELDALDGPPESPEKDNLMEVVRNFKRLIK